MASEDGGAGPRDGSRPGLRFWNRLSFRLAGLFALVTVLAVVLVGGVVYGRQKREVEDAVGTQLLNIARIGSLLVDARLHAQAVAAPGSSAYTRVQKTLNAIRTEAVLPTPIYTLALEKGMARVAVTGDDGAIAGTVLYPGSRRRRKARLDVRGRRRPLHRDLPERPGHVDQRVRARGR